MCPLLVISYINGVFLTPLIITSVTYIFIGPFIAVHNWGAHFLATGPINVARQDSSSGQLDREKAKFQQPREDDVQDVGMVWRKDTWSWR